MERILSVLNVLDELVGAMEKGVSIPISIIDRGMTMIAKAFQESRDLTPEEFTKFSRTAIDDMRSKLHSDTE